ncbi:MAG: tail assembly chaperone [Vagococcus salmoninarum]|uniref:tail assembly chaperone n=1 Tax=Vagococcus salmoninarum TaxID=2739 RepID=UPI003F9ADCC7
MSKVVKFPTKMETKKITFGEEGAKKEIVLNFGLGFATKVDHYMIEEAANSGIDNIVLISASLLSGNISVLIDLLRMAISHEEVTEDELEAWAAVITEKELEGLYQLFFANLVANPLLKRKVNLNMELLNSLMESQKLQEEMTQLQMKKANMDQIKELNKLKAELEG